MTTGAGGGPEFAGEEGPAGRVSSPRVSAVTAAASGRGGVACRWVEEGRIPPRVEPGVIAEGEADLTRVDEPLGEIAGSEGAGIRSMPARLNVSSRCLTIRTALANSVR